jgi:MscS family membrane protein
MIIIEKPMPALSRVFVFVSVLFLILATSTPLAVAQDKGVMFDPYPLRPADTSSPRDTLRSFNENINLAIQAWHAGEPRKAVVASARRGLETLALSQLPERGLFADKIEIFLLLKEILDRIVLPPQEEIPGKEEVADDERRLSRWTIPNTNITIAKIEKGPRAGEFLFTAETVRRLKESYERVKNLPYKPGAAVGTYEDFSHSPGGIVPRSWATALPAWSKTVVLGETLWQWLGLVIIVVAAFLVVCWLLRWGHRWDERHRSVGVLMRFGAPLSVLVSILIIYASRFVLLDVLKLIELWIALSFVLWALIFAGIGWFLFLFISRITDAINEARRVKEGTIDSQLVRTVLRLVSLIILVLLFIRAADFFGVPLTPVLAGLGVGGLAIALAVRPTLENIIGGLTMFADKPLRVGDFCRYGDKMGTVVQIGLRSTRVRARDRTVVSIPNAEFSQMQLENLSARDKMLYRFTLGLRYETTPDQLRYVIANMREMLLGHPRVQSKRLRVRFRGFGAYSLNVEVYAFVNTRDYEECLGIQEDLNLRIIDIVAKAGTGFAFPSQTAYLGRDTGLNAERGREAETRVQEWRSKGQLPFPEFDEVLRGEKEDILDYPSEGTPGYKPIAGLSDPPQEPEVSPSSKPKPKPKRMKRKRTRITNK